MSAPDLVRRLADVRSRITRAAERSGRDPSSIRLIAVTKGVGMPAIAAAAAAGVGEFGENRVQEAVAKMAHEGEGAGAWRWHLIGRLQTNKVRAAVGRFTLIQSVDSLRLGQAIDDAADRLGIVQSVLIQVNVGREPQKGGVLPEDTASLWDALQRCRRLRVEGVMAVPPAVPDADGSRPYFCELKRVGGMVGAVEYSMGMSHDFEVAIEEGATMVRVGTAIFGARGQLTAHRSQLTGHR